MFFFEITNNWTQKLFYERAVIEESFSGCFEHLTYVTYESKINNESFPNFKYTGKLRAAYPLSPKRAVPQHIKRPDYAQNGRPVSEIKNDRTGKITTLSEAEIKKIRKVGLVSRKISDKVASHIAPGVTTDELDAVLHKECMAHNAYSAGH